MWGRGWEEDSVGRGGDGAAMGLAGALEGVWMWGWGRQEWATSGICAGEDRWGREAVLESGGAGRGTSWPLRCCHEWSRYQSRAVWAGRRTEDGQAEVSNPTGMQLQSAPLLWCPRIMALVPQTSCCSLLVSLDPLLSSQGALVPQNGDIRSCQVTSL